MSDDGHDWELKGGGMTSSLNSPMGLSLWQCRECGLAASRALTNRNEALNSVVPTPDVDPACEGGSDGA